MASLGDNSHYKRMTGVTLGSALCLRTVISRSLLLVLFFGGCAGPSVRQTQEISIRLYDDADYQMIVGPAGRPKSGISAGSGAAHGAGVGFKDCSSAFADPFTKLFAGSLCGAVGAVVGAGVGAVISSGEGGNTVATNSGLSVPNIEVKQAWHTKLQDQLETVGQQRGKVIVEYPDGVTVHVVVDEFRWDVKKDQTAAILGTLLVAVGENGDYSLKQVSLISPYLEIDEWLASGGQRVTTEVDGFGSRIAAKVWDIVD